jgi:glutamyl-tRNA synthetase
MARHVGARIIMRMEDLDVGRAKPESVQQAYDDLRWLGMDWDPDENASQAKAEVVQSERLGLYHEVLERLWERDAIYPCTCSRAQIAASVASVASAPHAGDPNVRYPGTCAHRRRVSFENASLDETARIVAAQMDGSPCWRLRVAPGPVAFQDIIAGDQSFDVATDVGDFPLTRFDNTPAYQLACVVDDHALAIDSVVRGDDLLASTPRQIALYHALDWQPPHFAHVPLVIGADGKRLAKRHGESRIAQFRAADVSPEKIVGWVAWRSGQLDRPREIAVADLIPNFDLAKLPRERIILTPDDLAWLT